MSDVSEDAALVDALTELVATTPGVSRLYPATRVAPLFDAVQGILPNHRSTTTATQVRVDGASSRVSVSIGVDLAGSAGETGTSVCSRLAAHLTAAGRGMSVKVTIVHISG